MIEKDTALVAHQVFPGKYSRKQKDVPWRARVVVFQRDNWSCVVCGINCPEKQREKNKLVCAIEHNAEIKLTVDHIVPKTLGSTNAKYNLIALCQKCNNFKSAKQPMEWLLAVKDKVKDFDGLNRRILFALNMHMVDAEL